MTRNFCKRCGRLSDDAEWIEGEGHVCVSCELVVEQPPDGWQMLAKHAIGEITDAEYADYLEARSDHDPNDPGTQILITRLREA